MRKARLYNQKILFTSDAAMKVSEIRQKFLQFFESKGHTIVPSSSLVPGNDPTLLFTNSGMVQFKDVFTGQESRAYKRATSSQRSVRAGGKHNDLENVGYTARHHTFFEMLGNFSFGDYFKRDAIHYAWELLTQVYVLPKDKLWVTVYHEDDEAYGIWRDDIGVPVERIIRIGDNKGARYASDNFWQMADTGPCGPCSEIFFDHGADVWGGPPGSPEEDGDRYIEIWNLVFMQFERDSSGVMHPLPKPCVDTGMGLERIAAVLQHVHSNYEIDLFMALIKAAARETGCQDLSNNSLKVIADHIRACAFLVVDGVIPSNEGRGYVLRRIIRRALRHGYKLGQSKPFFHRLVDDLVIQMGQAFPELQATAERVTKVLEQEEWRFGETLENGMRILDSALSDLSEGDRLDGQTLFMLYDTYGFPVDLTADICRERKVDVDLAGFELAMGRQRDQARAAGRFKATEGLTYTGDETVFRGYDELCIPAKVTALYREGSSVDHITAGQLAIVVLDQTPFYAESGGQVGDAGLIQAERAGSVTAFQVNDTQKVQAGVFGHHGELVRGQLAVGDTVEARVDQGQRSKTIRNHSATHLMHKALREVLGGHVQQRGSLVDAQKTRFDFSHDAPMTPDQISQVEELVNQEILANAATQAQVMGFDDAIKHGAMALFGEKYGDEVRVLDIGTSKELCGGTHVTRTGDIGLFKIIAESGVAAGVRRVEAITGDNALHWAQQLNATAVQIAALVKSTVGGAAQRVVQLQEQLKDVERELEQAKSKLNAGAGSALAEQVIQTPNGLRLLVKQVDGVDPKALRSMVDQLKDKLGSAVVVLATVAEGKVSLIAGVTGDLTATVKAGDVVAHLATLIGGKGGGRADMAMGGGTDIAALAGALAGLPQWVDAKVMA